MKKREQELDYLRGIAILIVVLGHSLQVYYELESVLFQKVWKVIQTFQMPLLMGISGYAIGFSFPIQNTGLAIKNKINRLLLPYLSWSLISYILSVIIIRQTISVRGIAYNFIQSQFWFLRHLFIYNLFVIGVSLIITFFCKKENKLYSIVQMTLLIFSILPVAMLSKVMILSSCINIWQYSILIAGIILNKILRQKRIKISLEKYGWISIPIMLICIAFFNQIDNRLVGLIIILALLWGFLRIYKCSNKKLNAWICGIGRKTLYIYAIHWVLGFKILMLGNVSEKVKQLGVPGEIFVIITFIYFLFASLYLGWVFQKHRISNRILLGDR